MTREQVVRAAADGDDVLPVLRAAFGDAGEQLAELWTELSSGDLVRASLVAVDGSRVVGHVGLSHTWVDARRQLVDAWLLSPLAVLPAQQGRGIGSALVRSAVECAGDAGVPLLFLEGSPAYYGRLGLERASTHGFAAPSDRIPDPAFQVVRFPGHEDWMAGRVVYPDVWWRHDAVGLRDPLLAEMEGEWKP